MNQQRPFDASQTLSLAASLVALERMTMAQLHARWQEVFAEPCRSRNRAYLLKRLRYQLQEQAHGGLSEAARQRILALADTSTLRQRPPPAFNFSPSEATTPEPPLPPPASATIEPLPENLPVHPSDARLPAPGAMLRRIYQDKVYEVKVLEDGFEYQGQHHKSLSRIARLITGTSWNGFTFFNLTKKSEG